MKIIIYGEPVAQSRPRFARTKYGVRTYTDSKVADYREQVQFQALNQYKDEPMTGALRGRYYYL
ncbi:RusA family crossover junction endodeoxyribonuclease [Lapidilactobacillus luobeiensis]|uniref:RusA family crossover junction endodeoxyribonuclease n=1 Tax=Lapidilactobacillus luobeiensis TaxID=2950371 RepID=UPI0021C2A586|nr:RusA family crossover junction endodeoxyribonuclease [Lapidilactobacillus luobeiensis]